MKSPSGMIFFYHPNEKKNVIEIESKPLVLCKECKRNADNGGLYPDGRTRCPIQETYATYNGHIRAWCDKCDTRMMS